MSLPDPTPAAAASDGASSPAPEAEEDKAAQALLHALQRRGYRFVTPTPASHARVLARGPIHRAADLRDVFGWSRAFEAQDVEPEILKLMRKAGVLLAADTMDATRGERGGLRSAVRVSSLDDRLFMHDRHPTQAADAVFFGPDSYRFAAFIRASLGAAPAGVVIDICTGAGVGALVAASHRPNARLILTDVNPRALRMARINAAVAGAPVETRLTSGVDGVDAAADLVLANPPYLIDPAERAYRHGGALHGGQLSLDLAGDAVRKLAPGGRLLLYTGAAVVAGESPLQQGLARLAAESGCAITCRELDPDVFGEELDLPAYAEVERIAVIGAVLTRR